MRQILTPLLLLSCLSIPADAATHGHGHVELQGNIIDTACTIATGDADQGIDMGTLAASELVNDGRGPSVPFTIRLVNCVLDGSDLRGRDHWKDVRITFDGEASGQHRFALQGEARGEALAIADISGNEAEPGEPMPATAIEPGNMALHYKMWLTSNQNRLKPGRFHTTVRYFMEYD